MNGIDKCAKDTSSYEGAYDFVAYDKPSRRAFYVWKYEPKVEKKYVTPANAAKKRAFLLTKEPDLIVHVHKVMQNSIRGWSMKSCMIANSHDYMILIMTLLLQLQESVVDFPVIMFLCQHPCMLFCR